MVPPKTTAFPVLTVRYIHHPQIFLDFPGGSDSKESTCNAGDLGLIPKFRRSLGKGHGNPLQYSCLENPHGQRSLVGYSPWGHEESDTTEQLSTHTYMHIVGKERNVRRKKLST